MDPGMEALGARGQKPIHGTKLQDVGGLKIPYAYTVTGERKKSLGS